MPAKRVKPDETLCAVIPAIRCYPSELQRVKQASAAQRISLSVLIRRILSDAIRPPIILQLPATSEEKKRESNNEETAGLAQVSERKQTVKRCKKHGIPKDQCFTCQNIGA